MEDRPLLTFFTLPLEVRFMIYGFCLDVGKVFPFYWQSGAVEGTFPTVALLRVCKTIHSEAEPILYRNTFVLSTYQATEKLFKLCLDTRERKLLLKSVEIGLFHNGIDGRAAVHQAQMMTIDADIEEVPDDTPCSRWDRILHHLTKSYTRTDHWQRTVSLILDNLNPDRLIMDLRECYCNSGCCDMQITAIECFSRGFALAPPGAVKLEGLIGFDETVENTMADDLALEIFEFWTSKRTGCVMSASATSAKLLCDADASIKEEVQAELNSNGNW